MPTTSYTGSTPVHVLRPDRLATLGLAFANVGTWLCAVVAPAGLAG